MTKPFYLTLEITPVEDDDTDQGDLADAIVHVATEWFAGSGEIRKIEIQSISDTVPTVHGRER